MAEEGVKIKLGADDAELQQKIKASGETIENFSHKVSASTFIARNAVLDFGHTLRDLPYAIANPALLTGPIDRTVQLFTQLQQQGGGVKGALQSIGSVLSGSGGILIGFELLTTAATFFFKGMISNSEKAKQELDDFNKTLNSAASEAAKQAASISELVNALESGTLNGDQRKKALEELKSQNVQYFGQLKEENGIVGGLSAAYDEYIAQLNNVGIAKAVEAETTKLFDKKLQLQLSIDPKFVAATDASTQRVIGNLKKQLESLGGAVDVTKLGDTNIFSSENDVLRKRIDIQDQIGKLEQGNKFFRDKDYNDTVKQINDIDLRIKGLADFQKNNEVFDIKTTPKDGDKLKQEIEATQKLRDELDKLGIDSTDITEKLIALKKQLLFRDAGKLGLDPQEINAQVVALKRELQDAFDKQGARFEIKAQPSLDIKGADLSKLAADADKIVNPFSKAVEKLFKEQHPSKIFSDDFIKAIDDMVRHLAKLKTEAINMGKALEKNVKPAFDIFFDDLLNGKGAQAFADFGKAIEDIIKKLIAAALEALIFNSIIGIATGGASFGGGAGTFLGGFKNLFGGATGINLNSANSGGITGTGLMSVNLQPSVAIHGNTLRILLNRVDLTNSRIH